MVCSGDGAIEAYKVEIPVNEGVIKFITKYELGVRDRIRAAALMDYVLQDFEQDNKWDSKIAFMSQHNFGWQRIGYVVREVTD